MRAMKEPAQHTSFVQDEFGASAAPSGATNGPKNGGGRRNGAIGEQRAESGRLSVKAMLRVAFAVVLVGTLAIGAFSLAQISRLNDSTESIYEQGHLASRAAEEARGHML